MYMLLDLAVSIVNNNNKDDEQQGGGVGTTIWYIVSLIVWISAVALSWNCNTKAGIDTMAKVLYAIAAALFSHFYLIFYLVYRVILKNPC